MTKTKQTAVKTQNQKPRLVTPPPQYTDAEIAITDVKNGIVRADLMSLCEEYRVLQDALNTIEADKKRLLAQIKPLADRLGAKVVRSENWNLVRSKGGRSEIKAERLLEKGVKLSTIEYATVKQEWTYYQVTAPRAASSEGTGEGAQEAV